MTRKRRDKTRKRRRMEKGRKRKDRWRKILEDILKKCNTYNTGKKGNFLIINFNKKRKIIIKIELGLKLRKKIDR